jgi:DNA repair photolyase
MTIKIGVTERGDAGLDFSWVYKSKKYDGMILITKRLSRKFIEEVSNVNCIVHATITGHGGTIYEPNVPDFSTSKTYFDLLINKIGPERVVLRIDPIIPDSRGIAAAIKVYEELYVRFGNKNGKKTRVRISFMDNYPHVKQRFKRARIKPLKYNFHAPLQLRKKISTYFPHAEICGEPGFDCTGCISEKDLKILDIDFDKDMLKFKGFQRQECKCLSIKTEILGNRGQCEHGCIYCYWK